MSYIYKLTDPRNSAVRYIGKTKDVKQRLISHKSEQTPSNKKGKWINELRTEGLSPILDIIEEIEERYTLVREAYWIYHYLAQGASLLNDMTAIQRRFRKAHSQSSRLS